MNPYSKTLEAIQFVLKLKPAEVAGAGNWYAFLKKKELITMTS